MNYPHYQPDSDHRPLTDEEIEQLDDALAATGRDGPSTSGAGRFLAALLLSPRAPARKTWRRLAARHLGRRWPPLCQRQAGQTRGDVGAAPPAVD